MNTAIAFLVGYLVLVLACSLYAARMMRTKKDGAIGYLLAGKSLPAPLTAVMVAGLAVGGASTVGVAEMAYKHGLSASMYCISWGGASILVGFFAAEKIRSMKVSTLPSMFEDVFSKEAGLISLLLQVAALLGIVSLQFIAGGAILSTVMPGVFSYLGGMILTSVAFVGMSLLGGYWAASLSNFINVLVIYTGLMAAGAISLNEMGGFAELKAQLPEGDFWFDPVSGIGLSVVVAWWLAGILSKLPNQAVVQAAFASKSPRAAKRGYLLAGIIILPVGVISALLGIIAAAKFPNLPNASMALPALIGTLPTAIGGLVIAALWAADLSTASGLLIGGSTLVMQDFYLKYVVKNISKTKEIFVSRVIVLFFALVSFIIATNIKYILSALTTITSIYAPYTFVMVAMMYFPSILRKSTAFWTISTGGALLVFWLLFPNLRVAPHVVYYEIAGTIISMTLTCIFDNRHIDTRNYFGKS